MSLAGIARFLSPILGWFLKCLSLAAVVWIVLGVVYVIRHSDDFGSIPSQFGYIALAFLMMLAIYPMYYGHKLCQRTTIPFRHGDRRAPIVFFRAFGDDERTTLQPAGWVAKFHGLTPPFPQDLAGISMTDKRNIQLSPRTVILGAINPIRLVKLFFNADRYFSEELFAGVFRKLGPFVAIGRPGEPLPTPGAEKMYVGDDEWQDIVLKYLKTCQAVVIQPSKSPGVRWEVEQALREVAPEKVLFVMSNFHGRPGAYEEFRVWLADHAKVQFPQSLPSDANGHPPSLIDFEKDGTPRVQPVCYRSPLLWPFLASGVDEERTFGAFLKGLKGEPKGTPVKSPRHFGQRLLSVVLVVPLFFATVMGVIFHDKIAPIFAPGISDMSHGVQEARFAGFSFRLGRQWKTVAKPETEPMFRWQYMVGNEFRGGVQLIASRGPMDGFDRLAEEVRQNMVADLTKGGVTHSEVVLESRQLVSRDGLEWVDLTFRATGRGIRDFLGRVRAHSDPERSASLVILVPDHPRNRREVELMVENLRYLAPASQE